MREAWEAHQQALEELQIPKIHELKEMPEEFERMANQRVQELLEATGEPVAVSKYKEPVMYYEPAEGTGGLPASICTCGWSKRHLRLKVLMKASEKHYAKTGHKPAPLED